MKAPYLLIPALFAFGSIYAETTATEPKTTVVGEDEADADADEDMDEEEQINANNTPRSAVKPTAMAEAPKETTDDTKPTAMDEKVEKPADVKPAPAKPTAMAETKPAEGKTTSSGKCK